MKDLLATAAVVASLSACATRTETTVTHAAPIPEACAAEAAAVRQVEEWRRQSDTLPSLRYVEQSRRAVLVDCLDNVAPRT